MSEINQLYQSIPVEQRICEGCGERIERNLAVLDDQLYHWGCLKKSKAKPIRVCLDCFSFLTRKGVSKVTVNGETQEACGNCGSPELRKLRRGEA